MQDWSTAGRGLTGGCVGLLRYVLTRTGPSALLIVCNVGTVAASAQTPRRPMTVPDMIEMTTFGSQPPGSVPKDIDVQSPDGRLHAVVVRRGDLAHNTNVFSLLVLSGDQLLTTPKPDTVLTLVSSSNRPAISHLKWLSDNRTLAFLGERSGESP